MELTYAVVLTGGIATGKSTAAEMFVRWGWTVIDADVIAHTVLDDVTDEVGTRFGAEVIRNGQIDRAALGAIVFADTTRRRELEALVHPLIREEIIKQAASEEAKATPYLIDIPLFYERQTYPIERVVLVYAPRDIQIRRLMARSGLNKAEARMRLEAQMDIEAKRARATWVIDNSGDRMQLMRECERVRKLILDSFSI